LICHIFGHLILNHLFSFSIRTPSIKQTPKRGVVVAGSSVISVTWIVLVIIIRRGVAVVVRVILVSVLVFFPIDIVGVVSVF